MSTDWSACVWSESCQTGNRKLLLLAIAEAVGDDGSTTDLTITALMQRTGLKERGVQTLLQKLEQVGELRREIGAGPHGRNRYTILLGREQAAPADAAPSHVTAPEQQVAHEVQCTAPTPPASVNGAGAASCTPLKERRNEGARVS